MEKRVMNYDVCGRWAIRRDSILAELCRVSYWVLPICLRLRGFIAPARLHCTSRGSKIFSRPRTVIRKHTSMILYRQRAEIMSITTTLSNDLNKVDSLQGSIITRRSRIHECHMPTHSHVSINQSIWMETPDTRSRATLGEKMDRQHGQKTQGQTFSPPPASTSE
jgi:hypothetical protein